VHVFGLKGKIGFPKKFRHFQILVNGNLNQSEILERGCGAQIYCKKGSGTNWFWYSIELF
jgi:hypothetical protein